METFVDIVGTLTTIVGLLGIGLASLKWKNSVGECKDIIFCSGLLLGVTGFFGMANAVNLDLDWLLYPLRFGIMLWFAWILLKYKV